MKLYLFFLYALMATLTIQAAIAVTTFESGTVFEQSNGVRWNATNTLTVDNLTMGSNFFMLENDNLSLRPSSGSLNISIISWTGLNSHNWLARGESQNIDFDVAIGSLPGVLVYDGVRYDGSFTATDSYETLRYARDYNLTLTFYDEQTRELLNETNVTVDFISDELSTNQTTSTGVMTVDALTSQEYIIRYSAPGYDSRSYFFELTTTTDTNLTLYLINESDSDIVLINVYDKLGNSVSGARIKILKYFVETNDYELVEIAETNFQGQVEVALELESEYYQFIIEYEGLPVYTSEPTYIYATTLNFYIDIRGYDVDEVFQMFGLSGSITFDNTSNTATYVYNDENNVASSGCLYAYKQNDYYEQELVNSSCASSPSGVVQVSVENITGQSYQFKGYITKEDNTYLVVTYNHSYDTPMPDNTIGLFFLAIIMMVSLAMYMWNEIVASLVVFTMPMLFSIAGLIPIGLSITIPVFFLGITIAAVLGVRRG